MSNIIQSVASTAGFIPEWWSAKALDVLRARVVLANIIARDFDYSPGWVGKELHIGYPGTFSVQTKQPDTPISPAAPTGSTVNLTLDTHNVVSFLVEDMAAATANAPLIERYLDSSVTALAEQLETDIWTQVQNLTPTLGSSGVDIDAALIRSARQKLTDNRAPMADRSLVVSPKDESAILSDTDLTAFYAYSQAQDIRNGLSTRLYGFDVYTSALAPLSAGATTCAALHKNALLLAVRPFAPIPAGSGVAVAQQADPESGLSLRLTMQWDPSNIGCRVQLDLLYGIAVLRTDQGINITT